MTILPKVPKPTPAEEKRAYKIATDRDGGDIVDGGICQRCLRDCGMGATSRDHRKGRGVGGQTTPANLQVLGGTGTTGCHAWKGANPEKAIEDGWAVPSYADPLVWPARRWQRDTHNALKLRWCLYDNAGGVHWITDEEAARRMNWTVA